MAVVKQPVGAKAALSITLAGLASGSYATSAAKDNTGNQPVDLLVELSVTPGATSGNKQAVLFALASLDGTNYQTGNSPVDELAMTLIGTLSLAAGASPVPMKQYSVAAAYGGVLPPFVKFVVKNDSGATFSAGVINVSEVSPTVT
jgi:hypothetical protein